ncbi:MAG: hypothetical protein AAF149_23110 [Bacteroidota bacterium]
MIKLLRLEYLYLIPLIISTWLSLGSFRSSWPLPFKGFSLLLLLTCIVEFFSILWKYYFHVTAYWAYSPSNLWVYNAFLSVRHLLLLSYFYGFMMTQQGRRGLAWSIPPFMLFAVVNYFFIQTPHMVNTYTLTIANSMTVLLAIYFFRMVMLHKEIIDLTRSTEVWIALGTFLYYTGTLPFFVTFNYLIIEKPGIASSYLVINDVLNFIMYTSYAVAFLCKPHFLK